MLALVAAVSAALAATAGAPAAGAANGSWTFGDGPVGLVQRGTLLADGRALVVTGDAHCSLGGCYPLNSDWLFEPATGKWTRGSAPPFLFEAPTLVPLPDGGALLMRGSACEREGFPACVPTTQVYRFDPGSGTWSSSRPMREARDRPIAVLMGDGRVLVAGGFGADCTAGALPGSYSCAPLSSAETYDPASGEWSAAASLPHADAGGAGVELSDGSALVLIPEKNGSAAVRFDPASGSWRPAGHTAALAGVQLVAPPGGRPLALLGGGYYPGFFGSPGTAATGPAPKCDATFAESYVGGEEWMPAPPLAASATSGGCPEVAALAGGQVLASAAGNAGPRLLDAAHLCWSETAAPPPSPSRPDQVVLGLRDGRALVTGSQGGAYLFTPGPDECLPPPVRGGGPPPRHSHFAGVAIVVPRGLALVRGRLRLRLACPRATRGACVGKLSVYLHLGKRLARLQHPFRIRSGATATVLIAIPRSWQARLHRRGVTLSLVAQAREVGGESAVTRAVVAVRR